MPMCKVNFELEISRKMKGIDYVTELTLTVYFFYLSTPPSEKLFFALSGTRTHVYPGSRRGFESRSGQKLIFRMGVSKGKKGAR